MNAIRVLCLGLLVMVCYAGTECPPATAMAQDTNHTTISGVVLDANNARVVDTLVTIENSKIKQQVNSDDEGRFRVELPPGDYQITAVQSGFKRFEFSPFRAKPGVCELMNIHLEVEVPKSPRKIN